MGEEDCSVVGVQRGIMLSQFSTEPHEIPSRFRPHQLLASVVENGAAINSYLFWNNGDPEGNVTLALRQAYDRWRWPGSRRPYVETRRLLTAEARDADPFRNSYEYYPHEKIELYGPSVRDDFELPALCNTYQYG